MRWLRGLGLVVNTKTKRKPLKSIPSSNCTANLWLFDVVLGDLHSKMLPFFLGHLITFSLLLSLVFDRACVVKNVSPTLCLAPTLSSTPPQKNKTRRMLIASSLRFLHHFLSLTVRNTHPFSPFSSSSTVRCITAHFQLPFFVVSVRLTHY